MLIRMIFAKSICPELRNAKVFVVNGCASTQFDDSTTEKPLLGIIICIMIFNYQ